jgi:hypothetical protein
MLDWIEMSRLNSVDFYTDFYYNYSITHSSLFKQFKKSFSYQLSLFWNAPVLSYHDATTFSITALTIMSLS